MFRAEISICVAQLHETEENGNLVRAVVVENIFFTRIGKCSLTD